MKPRIERTFLSRRIREKLRSRGIEPYHINQAIRNREVFRRARYGAYAAIGRDESGRRLLVVFHLRGATAHVATARQVT